MAGACCGRPLVATADLTATLWGSRDGSAAREGATVLSARGEWLERARGGGSEMRRSMRARAKHSLWARPEHVHQVLGEMPEHAKGLG